MKKLFIIFAVLCLAAPAMAADWNFFGSARFKTFWIDDDPDVAGVDSDSDLQWDQQGNSRIGANVKFNDQIGGAFEYGTGVNLRKLYGTYAFGGGSELLFGQTYTPSSSLFYSNSVFGDDGDLLGVGEFYVGRVPMVQWKMGGFKLALIRPSTKGYDETDGVEDFFLANGTGGSGNTYALEVEAAEAFDVDSELPKIEVAYNFKTDMFFADVFAGYQTYTLDAASDIDVDAYVLGGGIGANFGPIYVKVGAHFGQNLGNYGAFNPVGIDDSAAITAAGNDVDDSDGLGYLAVVGFNASEMLSIEAGYGHEEAEVDVANANTTEADQLYLNAVVTIAPGFFIVPEVGMITYSEDNSPAEPETFYVGAKWQINF